MIKKYKISLWILLAIWSGVEAQEQETLDDSSEETTEVAEFNRWSVEFNAGTNKAIRPWTDGYFADNPDKFFPGPELVHYDLGARYMFSNKFGLKLDVGYDLFENQKETESLPFESNIYRVSLQGVANLTRILNFEDFTESVGLLAHVGAGVSELHVTRANGKESTDNIGNIMVGLTAQLKLSNRLVANVDFTHYTHLRQHLNFDGQASNTNGGLIGSMFTSSVGLTYYFGKNEKHADWYYFVPEPEKLGDETRRRLDDMETMMNDSDKDGVPDYLDTENNTITGVAVDTKGRAIDLNKNGIPDELESALDARYSTIVMGNNMVGSNGEGAESSAYSNSASYSKSKNIAAAKELLEGGFVNVFFNFNSAKPTNAEGIYFVVNYMKRNADARLDVIGYADEVGDQEYNTRLSEQRAQAVYDILVNSGIDGDRLTIVAQGVDSSVDIDSADARKMARRVTLLLK